MSQAIPLFNDLDNDGVQDYVDLDSDNDGIPDIQESVVCETVDINSLNGSTDALNAFNEAEITVGGVNGSLIQIETPLTFVGGATIDEFIVSDDHTGNEVGMLLGVNSTDPSQFLGTYYDFSSPVFEFNFKIFDLDRTDAITVNGFFQGELQSFTIQDQGACVSFNGMTEFISTCNVQAGLDPIELRDHSFVLTFDGFIDRLEFTYYDQGPGNGGSFTFVPTPEPTCLGLDHDLDGVPDFLDLDSDNDGIPDAIEACSNINIVLNNCTLDFDNSGEYVLNNGESTGLLTNVCATAPVDTDNDNIPDYLDLDSDNDNCPDSIEECVPYSTANQSSESEGYDNPSADVNEFGLLIDANIQCFSPTSTDWIDQNVTCLSSNINLVSAAECFEENGIAEINIAGGELPYVINWSNGESNTINSNLAPGLASVTITDACDQMSINEINIPEESCTVGITINKTADTSGLSSPANVGDVILYSFEVCNTGTGKLRNVRIDDILFPVNNVIDTLLGLTCNTTSFTGEYSLTQSDIDNGVIENIASVSATQPSGESIMDQDNITIQLDQVSNIDIMKIANPQDENGNGIFEVNETIQYSFLIHNTSNVTLSNVFVIDDFVDVIGNVIPSMEPGEMNNDQFSATYIITQLDINQGFVFNQASVLGQNPSGLDVTDEDDTNISLVQDPEIMLLKESVLNDENQDGISQAGETIQYIFTVINSGNVSLTNLTLTDPLVTVNGSLDVLEPGEVNSIAFTGTYVITQNDLDAGMIGNSALIQANDPSGNTVTDISDDPSNTDDIDIDGDGDPDDITLTQLIQTSSISLLKIGEFQDENADGLAQLGETISYDFTITNTGNTSLSNIAVADPLISISGSIAELSPNEQNDLSITASYTITQEDIDNGFVENSSLVTSIAPANELIIDLSDDPNEDANVDLNDDEDPDDPTIVELPQAASINVNLTGIFADENGDDLGQPLETIDYNLTIFNTGNVTLGQFELDIPNVNILSEDDLTLAPGQSNSIAYSINYELTQEDIDAGFVLRSAEVIAVSPTSVIVSDVSDDPNDSTDIDPNLDGNPDDPTEVKINQQAGIQIHKSGELLVNIMPAELGQEVEYSFIIENIGNVTLSNINLTDQYVDLQGSPIQSLAPGEINDNQFSALYNIKQTDINNGIVFNEAIVSAFDPNQEPVTDQDDVTIDITQRAELLLFKAAEWIDENSDNIAQVGERIEYQFTIVNNGNVTIESIDLVDLQITFDSNPTISLEPGEEDVSSYSGFYILTQADIDRGFFENSAVVSGVDPDNMPVVDISDDPNNDDNIDQEDDGEGDDSTITTIPQLADISLLKEGSFTDENQDGLAQVGETIQYNFSIVNEGNVSLAKVHIVDPLIDITGAEVTLAPQQSTSNFSGQYTITQLDIDKGFVENTAIVIAQTPDGNEITDLSDDPSNDTNLDTENDGEPDDPTIVTLAQNAQLNALLTGVYNDENGDNLGQPNETISYVLTIKNLGNVTLSNYTIDIENVNITKLFDLVLTPGESNNTSYSIQYTVDQFDIDQASVTRSATVTAQSLTQLIATDISDDPNSSTDVDLNDDNNPDDPTRIPINQLAQIDLTKTGMITEENLIPSVGSSIDYSFTIQNTGNVTLTNVNINDPLVDVIGNSISTLPPGAVDGSNFYGQYIMTQSDIDQGIVFNEATVEAFDPFSISVTDLDDITIDISQNADLSLSKTGIWNDENGDGITQVGETISYAFTIENTGNVSIDNIIINDPIVTIQNASISLLPGMTDSDSFTGNYVISQDDIDKGFISNSAIITANDPDGNTVTDQSDDPNNPTNFDANGDGEPDDATVTSFPQIATISFNKSGVFADENADGLAQVGETIAYSFSVENTGNVTLYDVHIIDELITISGSNITLQNGETNANHFSGIYSLTQEDIDRGFVDNVATVNASTPQNEVISDTDDDRVSFSQEASINLLLSGHFNDENGDGLGQPNETISYQLEIINTGNVTLLNPNLVFENIQFENSVIDVIGPGSENAVIILGDYALTQDDIDAAEVIRQVSVQAVSNLDLIALDISDDPIDLSDTDMNADGNPDDPTLIQIGQYAQIQFLKSGEFQDENNDGFGQPEETILYQFELTNLGNVTLTDVNIADENFDELIISNVTLDPQESITVEEAYLLTQEDIDVGLVTNTAVAQGTDPDGNTIMETSDDPMNTDDVDDDMDGDPDDTTMTSIPQQSAMSVEMLGRFEDTNTDGFADVGEKIKYKFAVRNSGNVTLKNVMLSQENINISGEMIESLDPQDIDTSSFDAEYILGLNDVKNLAYTSQVKAEALNSLNQPLSDLSDDRIDLTNVDFEEDSEPDDPTTVRYCGIQINTLSSDPAECFDSDQHILEVNQTSEAIIPFGFRYMYVLTEGDQYTIEQISFTPEISISKTGNYHVHPFIAQVDQAGDDHYFDLSFIQFGASTINQLIEELNFQMVCADIDPIGTPTDIFNCKVSLTKEQVETSVLNDKEVILSFDIILTNIGEFPVANILLTDRLSFFPTALPSEFINAQNVELDISNINATALPTINPNYNGITDLEIFDGSDGFLSVGEAFLVNLKTKIDIEGYKNVDGPQVNTAEVTADAINQFGEAFDSIFELSDDPLNPIDRDVDNDGDPEDPTSISIPVCQDLVCNNNVNISLNENCTANLRPELFLKGPANFNNYEYEFFDENNMSLGDMISIEAVSVKVTHIEGCQGGGCWSQLRVESNEIPEFDSACSCENADQNLLRNCQTTCITNDLPPGVTTEEMVRAKFANCAPELVSLETIEHRDGVICDTDGEHITIQYIAKIRRHDRLETVDLLCQTYTIQNIEFDDNRQNLTYQFDFPNDLVLNCDFDSLQLTAEEKSNLDPHYLSRITDLTHTFPYFIDLTKRVNDTTFRYTTVQVNDYENPIFRDTVIQQDINGDNILEWVKTTIVTKPLIDSVVIDTIINTEAHPLIEIDEDGICNILSSYADASFSSCGNGQKIARTWSIINWCDADVYISAIQTIDIYDSSHPNILNASELSKIKYVETEPWSCSAKYKLPAIDANDNCDSELQIDWTSSHGQIEGEYIIEIYPHDQGIQVTATVTDACLNQTATNLELMVVDNTPPVALCHSSLQVSLTYSEESETGVATIQALDFDEGSHDECTKLTVQVIRQDDYQEAVRDCSGQIVGFKPVSCLAQSKVLNIEASESDKNCSSKEELIISTPGSSVSFCCEDVGQQIPVIVIVTDENGQSNECLTYVAVHDYLQAEIICSDISISCFDGDVLQKPVIVNQVCSKETILEAILLNEIRDDQACQNGTAIQEWYVDNDRSDSYTEGDAYCLRTIQVEADVSFDPYTIQWPVHRTGQFVPAKSIECDSDGDPQKQEITIQLPEAFQCSAEQNQDSPIWCTTDCGLVGSSVSIDTIQTEGACFDIIYSWTVIDWCTYNANNTNDKDVTDQFSAVEDWALGACTECPANTENSSRVYYAYDNVDIDGYYHFDQVISIRDETAPVLNIPKEVTVNINCDYTKDNACCSGFEVIMASASDFCGDNVIGENLQWEIELIEGTNTRQTLKDEGVEISIRTLDGFNGDVHTIRWTVRDGCGNVSVDTTHVGYVDIQAPSPVCLASLHVRVDTSGLVWAKDFDFGSFDNCTATEDLQFSIVPNGTNPLHPSDPNFGNESKLDFSCEDQNLLDLDIWVWDAEHNGDFCQTVLLLQSDCEYENGLSANITGNVQTAGGDMVSHAMITLSSTDHTQEYMTRTSGEYTFTDLHTGRSYTSKVSKDDSYINGLSTKDLILIQEYILGKRQFDNPYQMIAADADANQSVSAADIILLKHLILGNSESLLASPAWRFIPAENVFFDEEYPWPFAEQMNYYSLEADKLNQDFIAVKIGDVSDDAIANNRMRAETRSADDLILILENQSLSAGELIELPVLCQNCENLQGHQFTFEHKGLELLDLRSASLDISRQDISIHEDAFTLSSHRSSGIHISENDVLYYLKFKALRKLELDQTIQLSDNITRSESYQDEGLNTTSISISFIEKNSYISEFEVSQNKPNPFSDRSQIEFSIPLQGDVQLQVYSLDGQFMFKKSRNFNAGEHIFNITRDELNDPGIYVYELDFNGNTFIGKMLVL